MGGYAGYVGIDSYVARRTSATQMLGSVMWRASTRGGLNTQSVKIVRMLSASCYAGLCGMNRGVRECSAMLSKLLSMLLSRPLLSMGIALGLSWAGTLAAGWTLYHQSLALALVRHQLVSATVRCAAGSKVLREGLETCYDLRTKLQQEQDNVVAQHQSTVSGLRRAYDRRLEALYTAARACSGWADAPVCPAVSDQLHVCAGTDGAGGGGASSGCAGRSELDGRRGH